MVIMSDAVMPTLSVRQQARCPWPARYHRLACSYADRDQDRGFDRQGDSTSDIARSMFLSRRTVQTYISHILTKLGAKSRVEIVREAMRQGVTP